MQNFKLNETEILSNQDWTFPTNTAYGPGRFKEIGDHCKKFGIRNPLIVTDNGSTKLPFIKELKDLLIKANIKEALQGLKSVGSPISKEERNNIRDQSNRSLFTIIKSDPINYMITVSDDNCELIR